MNVKGAQSQSLGWKDADLAWHAFRLSTESAGLTMSTLRESPARPYSPSPLRRAARHLSRYERRQSRAAAINEARNPVVLVADSTSGLM